MRTANTIAMGIITRLTNFPNLLNDGINERCCVLSMSLYVRKISAGMKVNTVIRLSATPFASARPRSGPIRNCIRHSARKPMTVVSPLDRMDVVDIVSA